MSKKRFDDANCAVARALNEVGDWWSLLIVLHAMYGTRRYVDFQQGLGIARNILCDRLSRLVENQVLSKVEVGEHGSRCEYRLTDKGRALFPVVVALRQWGDQWNPSSCGPALRDRATGRPLRPVCVQDADGKPLQLRDVVLEEVVEAAPDDPTSATQ